MDKKHRTCAANTNCCKVVFGQQQIPVCKDAAMHRCYTSSNTQGMREALNKKYRKEDFVDGGTCKRLTCVHYKVEKMENFLCGPPVLRDTPLNSDELNLQSAGRQFKPRVDSAETPNEIPQHDGQSAM